MCPSLWLSVHSLLPFSVIQGVEYNAQVYLPSAESAACGTFPTPAHGNYSQKTSEEVCIFHNRGTSSSALQQSDEEGHSLNPLIVTKDRCL